MSSPPHGDTVILGAGIIGLSTAYFLSQTGRTDPRSIHLVDASEELFHCASGFAGGFLAADCTFDAQRPMNEKLTACRVCPLQCLPRRTLLCASQVARRKVRWPKIVGLWGEHQSVFEP